MVRGAEETPEPKAVRSVVPRLHLLLQGAKDGEEAAGGRRAEIAEASGTRLRVAGTIPKNDQGY